MKQKPFCGAWRRLVLALMLCLPAARVVAQSYYDPVPQAPPVSDFIARTGTKLTLLGNPYRYGGMDIPWLGVRSQSLRGEDMRRPSAYEVRDAMETVSILTAAVVRPLTASASAGCALCIEPALGSFNEEALQQLDLVLKLASEQGLKVILPLLPSGGPCDQKPPLGQYAGTACTFLGWRGHTNLAEFFTDPQIRSDFLDYAMTIVRRTNSITHLPYHDDPTILAYENCEGCGRGMDEHALDAWTEAVGRAIHDNDANHLYENGAFADRVIGPAAVSQTSLALPSVDIVSDRFEPDGKTVDDNRMGDRLAQDATAVTHAGRSFAVDGYAWDETAFPQRESFQRLLDEMLSTTDMAGALLIGLQAHDAAGGLMKPPGQNAAEQANSFWFPGIPVAGFTAEEMQARNRAVRVFNTRMLGINQVPAYPPCDRPEITTARAGAVSWRGSAGARAYSVQISTDITEEGSWKTICDRCVNDLDPHWTDPGKPKGAVWYRLVPFNMNNHAGIPSLPAKNG